MSSDRFEFQRTCVSRTTGKVLNAGCKEDPAHLKLTFGERVVNLDIRNYNDDTFKTTGNKVKIDVDILYDLMVFTYPFKDREFEMVVLGDILEDLTDNGCQKNILMEARRIAKSVCITVPEDRKERDSHHLTTITENRLKDWLSSAGWHIVEFYTVNYGFVPRGFFVLAKDKDVV